MDNETYTQSQHGIEDVEIQEWLESLDSVLESSGPEVAAEILERLRAHAAVAGIDLPFTANTPYANTIPVRLEPLFPGDQELERRIKLAATSPPTPPPPPSTRSASTISSAPALPNSRVTPSTSRDTPPPEFTLAPSSKAASAPSSSKIFAAN